MPRFTPTHVGKTRPRSDCWRYSSVHPHTRGEDAVNSSTAQTGPGSPPHTWGRLREGRVVQRLPRFTPTHVGKTNKCASSIPTPAVHPHTRGEDQVLAGLAGHGVGSPPHTWGRQGDLLCDLLMLRFTPTPVGKTSSPYSPTPPNAVHPHTRGEDYLHVSEYGIVCGSPPHPWGRHADRRAGRRGERFTPTHVGKTSIAW